MTYISNTITNSNAPSVLYSTIATTLTTAGFTLVDTVVISTRTHKIWKSAAGSNAAGVDWYLDVAYTTTGAGSIWFSAFEFFDPATDLAYRGPYSTSSTVIDATTGSRYGATGSALETNWSPNPSLANAPRIDLPATSCGYWLSITINRVIGISTEVPNSICYAGLYEPDALYAAKVGGQLYPLISVELALPSTTPSIQSGGLTRLFPGAVLASPGWAGQQISHVSPFIAFMPKLPSGLQTGYPFVGSRLAISTGNATSTPGGSARAGMFYGLGAIPSSGVVRGDTITIGSDTWVCASSGSDMNLIVQAI